MSQGRNELTALLRGQCASANIGIARADLRLPMEEGRCGFPSAMREGPKRWAGLAFDESSPSPALSVKSSPEFGLRPGRDRRSAPECARRWPDQWRIEGVPWRRIHSASVPGRLKAMISPWKNAASSAVFRIQPLRYDIDADAAAASEARPLSPAPRNGEMRIRRPPQRRDGGGARHAGPDRAQFGDFRQRGAAVSPVRNCGSNWVKFPSHRSQLEGSGFLRLDDPRLALRNWAGRRLALDKRSKAGPRAGLL